METVTEMMKVVKDYYNLNDTLLAVELGVKSTGNITQWRKGETKPSKDRYIKLKALYEKVMKLKEDQKEETQLNVKERYELKYPENGTLLFYNDITTGAIREILYDADEMDIVNVYSFGMLYKTREEAIQKRLEFLLLKRINDWAEEHNEGWIPNWNDLDEEKWAVRYEGDIFYKYLVYSYQYFLKLPYFKSEEIAQQFIEEFGEQIKEVFCDKKVIR
jgi:hypothetical protein